jgi:hypothetical protein
MSLVPLIRLLNLHNPLPKSKKLRPKQTGYVIRRSVVATVLISNPPVVSF